MPTYVYACENHHLQEETHSMFVDLVVACDTCKAPMVRRPQLATVTFGSDGFYTTDKND